MGTSLTVHLHSSPNGAKQFIHSSNSILKSCCYNWCIKWKFGVEFAIGLNVQCSKWNWLLGGYRNNISFNSLKLSNRKSLLNSETFLKTIVFMPNSTHDAFWINFQAKATIFFKWYALNTSSNYVDFWAHIFLSLDGKRFRISFENSNRFRNRVIIITFVVIGK